MDHTAPRDRDFEADLESGVRNIAEDSNNDASSGVKTPTKSLLAKVCWAFADGKANGEKRVNLCGGGSADHAKLEGEMSVDQVEKKIVEEKRKKTSNKKPPRPPRGPSLDAADQKLIKEISELAMLKRARIERMKKALKKVKATKASSNSNLFAMVFTILFCLVILFQGMSSRTASTNSLGSPLSSETADDSLISVQYFGNPSSSESDGPGFGSPNFIESVAGSDPPRNPRRAVRWAGKRRQLL
uniref:Transmembrane protein n=1 Tax=Salix viminalis TaxID=40686 RepID=A0A6N2N9E0_SALVM